MSLVCVKTVGDGGQEPFWSERKSVLRAVNCLLMPIWRNYKYGMLHMESGTLRRVIKVGYFVDNLGGI